MQGGLRDTPSCAWLQAQVEEPWAADTDPDMNPQDARGASRAVESRIRRWQCG